MPDIAASSNGTSDRRVDWLGDQVCSALKVKMDRWGKFVTDDTKMQTLRRFLDSTDRALWFTADPADQLICALTLTDLLSQLPPTFQRKKSMFFVKNEDIEELSSDVSLPNALVFGDFGSQGIRHAELLVGSVLQPALRGMAATNGWPSALSQDMTRLAERLSARTSVLRGASDGVSVLPVLAARETAETLEALRQSQQENGQISLTEVQRELVHVLESLSLEWSHTVRAGIPGVTSVIPSSHTNTVGAQAGPGITDLAQWWKGKLNDLASVHAQLMQPLCNNVVELLTMVESRYATQLTSLIEEVTTALGTAERTVALLTRLDPLIDQLKQFADFDNSTSRESFEVSVTKSVYALFAAISRVSDPAGVTYLSLCCAAVTEALSAIGSALEPSSLLSVNEASTTLRTLHMGIAAARSVPGCYQGVKGPEGWPSLASIRQVAQPFIERLQQVERILVSVVEFDRLQRVEIGGSNGGLLTSQLANVHEEFRAAMEQSFSGEMNPLSCLGMEKDVFYEEYSSFTQRLSGWEQRVVSVLESSFGDAVASLRPIMRVGVRSESSLKAQLERRAALSQDPSVVTMETEQHEMTPIPEGTVSPEAPIASSEASEATPAPMPSLPLDSPSDSPKRMAADPSEVDGSAVMPEETLIPGTEARGLAGRFGTLRPSEPPIYESCSSALIEATHLLTSLSCVATLPSVATCLHERYKDLLALIDHEIQVAQYVFERDKESPSVAPTLPPVAGRVEWARSLVARIRPIWQEFCPEAAQQETQSEIAVSVSSPRGRGERQPSAQSQRPPSSKGTTSGNDSVVFAAMEHCRPQYEIVKQRFNCLEAQVEDYVHQLHQEWCASAETVAQSRIDEPLLREKSVNEDVLSARGDLTARYPRKADDPISQALFTLGPLSGSESDSLYLRPTPKRLIEVNFSKSLSTLLLEVRHLRIAGLSIPDSVTEIHEKGERLLQQVSMLRTMVTQYNYLQRHPTEIERPLYQEELDQVDKEMEPGFSDLRWTSDPQETSPYISRVSKLVHDLYLKVNSVKEAVDTIEQMLRRWAGASLIERQPKKAFDIASDTLIKDNVSERGEEGRSVIYTQLTEIAKILGIDVDYAALAEAAYTEKMVTVQMSRTVTQTVRRKQRVVAGAALEDGEEPIADGEAVALNDAPEEAPWSPPQADGDASIEAASSAQADDFVASSDGLEVTSIRYQSAPTTEVSDVAPETAQDEKQEQPEDQGQGEGEEQPDVMQPETKEEEPAPEALEVPAEEEKIPEEDENVQQGDQEDVEAAPADEEELKEEEEEPQQEPEPEYAPFTPPVPEHPSESLASTDDTDVDADCFSPSSDGLALQSVTYPQPPQREVGEENTQEQASEHEYEYHTSETEVEEFYDAEVPAFSPPENLPPAWVAYLQSISNMVGEGLIATVLTGLQYIQTAFQTSGDVTSRYPAIEGVVKLIQGQVDLESDPKVSLPSGDEAALPTSLLGIVQNWEAQIINVGAAIRRPELLASPDGYREQIMNDPRVKSKCAELDSVVRDICMKAHEEFSNLFGQWQDVWTTEYQEYLHRFLEWGPQCSINGEREKEIQAKLSKPGREPDSDANAKILEAADKHAPTLQEFDAMVSHFQDEESRCSSAIPDRLVVGWLWLDLRPARAALCSLLARWGYGFLDYLRVDAENRLTSMQKMFNDVTDVLSREVAEDDYDGLVDAIHALHTLRDRTNEVNNSFTPLRDTFAMLRAHDGIEVSRQSTQLLDDLPQQWAQVQRLGYQAKDSLAEHQSAEVRKTREMQQNFSVDVVSFRDEFRASAAFQWQAGSEGVKNARDSLVVFGERYEQFKQRCAELNEKEELFELTPSDPTILRDIPNELSLLGQIWDVADHVDSRISEWQNCSWNTIDVNTIDTECRQLSKEVRVLPRQARAINCYRGLDQQLKNFLASLPLILDLKNPALRTRHWKQLSEVIGHELEMGDDFTLADFLALGLHQYAEDVEIVVTRAQKEQQTEQQLHQLSETWNNIQLTFTAGRNGPIISGDGMNDPTHPKSPRQQQTPAEGDEKPCPVVFVAPEVIEQLENDSVLVQNLMASRHVAFFLPQLTVWQTDLATIDQTIQLWLDVQKTHSHLAPIFLTSDDIRSQLPEQSADFEAINDLWNQWMERAVPSPRILEAVKLTPPGGLNTPAQFFEYLTEKLAICEKALQQYLELKRMAFPRFFFLSASDLLDCLSKSQQPLLVEPHVGKLFDSIKRLEWKRDENGEVIDKTALGIHSKDGEYVPFLNEVKCDGQVEVWLGLIEAEICRTLRALFAEAVAQYSEMDREAFIFKFPSQVVLGVAQVYWSTNVEIAFTRLDEGNEVAMREYSRIQHEDINNLVAIVRRSDLSAYERDKLVNCCTLEVHSRDVVTGLVRDHISSSQSFAWQSQLRPQWDEREADGKGDLTIHIAGARFLYRHEYLGNIPRLVVTPLTDRCYTTLTQSLHLIMGGAPAGPAGTGKTETVKDLAKCLGSQTVVFNCGPGQDAHSLGNIFRGLSSTGAFGCFDEFNRIAVEVLSVVATQVKTVLDGLRSHAEYIVINESKARLKPSVGIFITMNPGYAGRTELPENIKSLFRPVSMVVPDYALIAEIMLMSQGFQDARELSKKFTTLYQLSKQLLSPQHHYDWGLRAIKSVLVVAGSLKRADPDRIEEEVLCRALRDFNTPKIVAQDLEVFLGLIGDLFPNSNPPRLEQPELTALCRQVAVERGLQPESTFLRKCVELQELFDVRHSVMILGHEGVGKSSCWRVLSRVKELQGFKVQNRVLNPKVVPPGELYGFVNPQTRDWQDGLWSSLMRQLSDLDATAAEGTKLLSWLVADGEVDPNWIESLNTVMDDNRVLTLASNERIPLKNYMRLLIEVSSLRYATPATVSRAGILYINASDVGVPAFFQSWCEKQDYLSSTQRNHLTVLLSKYWQTCIEGLRQFKQCLPVGEIALATTLVRILEGMMKPQDPSMFAGNAAAVTPLFMSSTATQEKAEQEEMDATDPSITVFPRSQPPLLTEDTDRDLLEAVFTFALIWSLGGPLCRDQLTDHRDAFSKWWRATWKSALAFPLDGSIFDYRLCIDVDTGRAFWRLWSDDIEWAKAQAAGESENAELVVEGPEDVYSTLIETVDTRRTKALMELLVPNGYPLLLCGPAGAGKASTLASYASGLSEEQWLTSSMSLNYFSTAADVQKQLEAKLERKAGRLFAPPGKLRQLMCVQDLNMGAMDDFNTQSSLTILRQYCDASGWYDRIKLSWMDISRLQLLASLNPSAGSFTNIDPRLQRHFMVISCDLPSESSLERIYSTLLQAHFNQSFPQPVRQLVKPTVSAMLQLHQRVVQQFPCTASTFHYLFSLRELSNVAAGLCNLTPEACRDSMALGRAFVHETARVYSDRLMNADEIKAFNKLQSEVSIRHLGDQVRDTTSDAARAASREGQSMDMHQRLMEQPVLYAHFAGGIQDTCYAEIPTYDQLSQLLTEGLNSYNENNAQMPLVLFQDALNHVLRCSRIIRQPRGHALLVGVGGSGKQSLARLASYIAGYEVFQITVTSSYSVVDFKTDMQTLFRRAGVRDIGTSFLFTDSQILDEQFLVMINDLLSQGTIPGLFQKDELDEICDGVRADAKAAGVMDTRNELIRFFNDRVRRNLHVILCLSPVGPSFRSYARRFPALFACCQIDWFMPWPRDALQSVAHRSLQTASFGDVSNEERDQLIDKISNFMANAHGSVDRASVAYFNATRRRAHTTPKSFLELISLYMRLLLQRRADITGQIERLDSGLVKLESTERDVAVLQEELTKQQVLVEERKQAAEELLKQLAAETADVDTQRAAAEVEQGKCDVIAADCATQQADCEHDLAAAEPAIIAAEAALNTLNKANLTELKSFAKPADDVRSVMQCVLILISPSGRVPADLSWNAAKKAMGQIDQFLRRLKEYDKDHIPDELVNAVKPFIAQPTFTGEAIKVKSVAAAGICEWVRNVVEYNRLYRIVQPKRDRLAEANQQLENAQKRLAKVRKGLAQLNRKLADLQKTFEDATDEKNRVIAQAEATQNRLSLAQRLVSGLSSEKVRWSESIKDLERSASSLIGDLLIVASFASYAGCFSAQFRQQLVSEWVADLLRLGIPSTASLKGITSVDEAVEVLEPLNLLADSAQIAKWCNEGLPSDTTSLQNAAIIGVSERWPLLIDPQLQGSKWLRQRYQQALEADPEAQPLVELRFTQPKWIDKLAAAVEAGHAVLFESVPEQIDAILDPLLARQFIRRGRSMFVTLGDKQLEYNPNFRLFLQSRLSNPQFRPELQAVTTLINFSVTLRGLEDQFLGLVVNEDQASLEQQKSELMYQQRSFSIRLSQLEEDLLMRLSQASGDILGDETLVVNLETTKATAAEIAEKAQQAAITEREINAARELYRPVASRSARLYFLLDSLSLIHSMYQYSLASFVTVFFSAIRSTPAVEEGEEVQGNATAARVAALVNSISRAVYRYAVRGLFVQDKLSFSVQMTFVILQELGQIDRDELNFLLRGGASTDLGPCPLDWISEASWQQIAALSKISETFARLPADIQGSSKRWQEWTAAEQPETVRLPQDWRTKSLEAQLCILRTLRPDRLVPALRNYVSERLDPFFVSDVPNSVESVFDELSSAVPCFFVLSPGTDPTAQVEVLGQRMGFTMANQKFHNISLGQGQENAAEAALLLAASEGHWCVLQNIHLMQRWLPRLDKLIESVCKAPGEPIEGQPEGTVVHKDFRLFLSAEPAPVPQGILQMSIKLVNEPPSGVRENLMRALRLFSNDYFESSSKPNELKTIWFALCWFHALVLERRSFGPQGFTRNYPFSSGDLLISASVLYSSLENSPTVPWEDIRYLVGEILYGGHVSADLDRRLVATQLEQLLTPRLLDGCELAPDFPCPPVCATVEDYCQYVEEMLPAESPKLFGLHSNAQIGCLTTQATKLLGTLYDLQQCGGSEDTSAADRDAQVQEIVDGILANLNEGFDMEELFERCTERTPYASVCLQECERINKVISTIRGSLTELNLGLKGELTLSETMEQTMSALLANRVPQPWAQVAWPSLKALPQWLQDLQARVAQLQEWSTTFELPKSLWLAGLACPQSLLTAVLQTASRRSKWPLDKTQLITDVLRKPLSELTVPRDGAHIHGFFVEGARWDEKSSSLRESRLKELYPPMPVIHARAALADGKTDPTLYQAPVFLTRMRADLELVQMFNIKSRDPPSKWILAGVALLLSDD